MSLYADIPAPPRPPSAKRQGPLPKPIPLDSVYPRLANPILAWPTLRQNVAKDFDRRRRKVIKEYEIVWLYCEVESGGVKLSALGVKRFGRGTLALGAWRAESRGFDVYSGLLAHLVIRVH